MILGRRRNRVVGAIWGLGALGFLAAAVLLWLDQGRVGLEVPAALGAGWVSWMFLRQRVELDRHGVSTRLAMSDDRLLWAGVDRVEVRRTRWFRPTLVVHPKGSGDPLAIPASAAMRRRQRNRLLEFLTDLSRQHGFALVTVNGDVISGTRPESIADTAARVQAIADGTPIFEADTADTPGKADTADTEATDDGDTQATDDGDTADTEATDDSQQSLPADELDAVAASSAADVAADDHHPLTPPWLLPSTSTPVASDLD